ncbi:hypothetical protein A6A06_23590 [Streptomyces sp. CB02923]|uniref:hypothetical protein n=1 Tax=Streptomyces sp. CB02923 TaxID=1718985 RepID=UPI000939DC26|nr:hypothetical protein [Streptomyces sp. CB02923]OKI00152.1 hypothetical protein A6A06_23590 [Streptomyces sp. CB02923]
MSADVKRYQISLTGMTVDYLAGTSCMQGDEEPKVRAELSALRRWKNGTEAGKVSFETLAWLVEYLHTWTEAADNRETPGEERAAAAAFKKISAIYEKAKEEGGDVTDSKTETAPFKVKDVRGDIRIGATHSGGTPHALKEVDANGRNVPYCPTRTKDPIRSWGPAHEVNGKLDLCVKCAKVVPTGAVTVTEEEIAIPGLGRTATKTIITPVDGTTEEKAEEPMAAPAKKTAAKKTAAKKTASSDGPKVMEEETQKAAADEIRADIERLSSLTAEGKEDAVKELAEEITKKTNAITGSGAAAVKAKLRADKEKAVKDAQAAKKTAAKKPSTEVANLATKDFMKAEGVPELIKVSADLVKDIAANEFNGAYRLSEHLLGMRLAIVDEDGDPNLKGNAQQSRSAAEKMWNSVLDELPPKGENEDADVIRDSIGQVKKQQRNAMQDVLVNYVRWLDTETPKDEEEAAKLAKERGRFKNALEMFPEGHEIEVEQDGKPVRRPILWSERVYDYYDAKGKTFAKSRMTRAEEASQRRALNAGRRKEIAAAVEAGEISEEEAQETLNPGVHEKTPGEKRATWVEKTQNAWAAHAKEIAKLESEEEREEAFEVLAAMIPELRKALKKVRDA